MEATLVILAAGMGSRYGGNKQIDGFGPSGELLIEYSIFDAIKAGFNKIIFIVKPDILELVKRLCGDKIESQLDLYGNPIKVEYAFQDNTSIPGFYKIPPDRIKPFGTVHAVLCTKGLINEPFAVINADDYYGTGAFKLIYDEILKLKPEHSAAMVGYKLKNTVSENGTVTRGVCVCEDGKLRKVTETYKIKLCPDGKICSMQDASSEQALDPDSIVSMNFWGFTPWIYEELQTYFEDFLKNLKPDEISKECILPIMVDALVESGNLSVSVLNSDSTWFGVTYKEDGPKVIEQLGILHKTGVYPAKFW